jgi:hypothetical protein
MDHHRLNNGLKGKRSFKTNEWFQMNREMTCGLGCHFFAGYES